jgi:diguanylate cyclase (GGDEF)-like protein/PAS domain S-box-containing protein
MAVFRDLALATGDVFYVLRVSPDVAFEYVSDSVTQHIGFTPQEHYDDILSIMALLESRDVALLQDIASSPVGVDVNVELCWRHRDGHRVWMQHRGRKREREDGSVVLEGSNRDVTDLRDAEATRAVTLEEFRMLAEGVSDVIIRQDLDRRIEYVSPSVSALTGWAPADLVGRDIGAFWLAEDGGSAPASHSVALAGDPVRFRGRVQCRDGSSRWVEVIGKAILDEAGEPRSGITVTRDIDAQVRAEQALGASEVRFRTAMDEAPQGMAILDEGGRFVDVNPALCRLLARDALELTSLTIDDVLPRDDADPGGGWLRRPAEGSAASTWREYRLAPPAGGEIVLEVSLAVLSDGDGRPTSFVAQFHDVSELRAAIEALAHVAAHDRLTGLLNRGELLNQLDSRLTRRARRGDRLAVLFCDVDNLKAANDVLGHAAGDAVLAAVGERISRTVRGTDLVARVGGDEFVVVLDGVRDVTDAERLAESVHAAVAVDLDVDGAVVRPGISIGVTLAEQGQDIDEVLRDADTALYAAKRGGRDRVVTFERGMTPFGA